MRENPQNQTDIATLRQLTTTATRILTAPLRRRAALTYLRQRGIDATAIPQSWPLGYAPPGWTRLVDALRPEYGDQALLDAGLARYSSRGTLIDTFRDRILFPIHNTNGHIAGFTARDLSGNPDTPKYLNTPRTALYDKSSLLYGLHEANLSDASVRLPVIVEGPLDVLAIIARQAGTAEPDLLPVAACGTAFTPTHARLIAQAAFAHHCPAVIALDGDAAGRSAALATGEQLRQLGVDVRVAVLPNGTDPAEYLTRSDSTLATFRAEQAYPLLTIHVQHAIAAQGDRMQWIEGRLAAARNISDYLATYPASYAAGQIGWLSNALDLTPDTVKNELVAAYRRDAISRPERATISGAAGNLGFVRTFDRVGDLSRQMRWGKVERREFADPG